MARIFVSHSSRDNEAATDIKRWLETRGFEQVFLDIDKHTGIPAGSHWERELYRKISSSQAVILVVTPSGWPDADPPANAATSRGRRAQAGCDR
jgi:hypothetical protein